MSYSKGPFHFAHGKIFQDPINGKAAYPIASVNSHATTEGRANGHLFAASFAMIETLKWVRANYAAGSTEEINRRIDAAVALAEGHTDG